MTIHEWLKSGCDYQTGVELYEKHGRNKNLLRRFRRVENAALASKLKYELSKIANPTTFNTPSNPIQKSPKSIVFTPPKIKVKKPVDIRKDEESPVLKKMKSNPISF